MGYLLDTNVVSEWVKPHPNPGGVTWTSGVDEDRVYLSVVTLTELRHSIERLSDGKRRRRLDQWLREELPLRFEGRVLAIDAGVAERWGKVVARSEAAGRRIGTMDAFIAATAEVHELTLVTHNASDFKDLVPAVVNPWKGS